MRSLPPLRYLLLTLVGAAFTAGTGAMFICMVWDVWGQGQLSMRGGIVRLADSPLAFTFVTGLSGLLGAVLLCVGTPLMLRALFASAEARRSQEASAPWLYGRTRPGLLWILGVLLAFVGYALLGKLLS